MSEIIVIENVGMGWLRDFPDYRDFTPEQDTVPRRLRGCVKRSMEVQVDGASVESWQ